MRLLYLLRHAKSSWDDPALRDFDRPLNDRGARAAAAMARHIAGLETPPAHVLCSPSVRTRQTWAHVEPALKQAPTVAFPQSIYEAATSGLVEAVRTLPAHAGAAMLIGHNPGMQGLATWLAARDDRSRLARKYPTGALAVFALDIADWRGLDAGVGRLRDFVVPKQLM